MRSLKIYLGTMIVIFILALFVYAMSLVYVQSVETTAGKTVSVVTLTGENGKTVFSVFGCEFEIDEKQISEKAAKIREYMPAEVNGALNAVDFLSNFFDSAYNQITNGKK